MKLTSLLLTLAVLVSGLALFPSESRAADKRPPNIILIMADDLGYGDIEPFGQSKFETPSLQKLADEGVMLTDFYSGSAVCQPSRESLMRGMHTGRTQRQFNTERPLRPDDVTIAEKLKQAGYVTAIAGKWSLGTGGTTGAAEAQGFDHVFGFRSMRGGVDRYFPEAMVWDGKKKPYPGNVDGGRTNFSSYELREAVLGVIEENKDKPFFIYFPMILPHADISPPQDMVDAFSGRYPETPFEGGHFKAQNAPNAAFAAMVTILDDTVGAVMEKLQAEGLDRETLVIFTSDNGPVSVGGRDHLFFNSAKGLRGTKDTLYEGGIRVPFIARWPGHIPEGASSSVPGAFQDIFPTLADAAGLKPGPTPTGRSLLPALLDPDAAMPERPLYWALDDRKAKCAPAAEKGVPRKAHSEAVRLGNWKAIRPDCNAGIALYDLSKDPGEQHDVAAEHPEVMETITAIMAEEYAPDWR
ncbi:sulfatase-like hydrolase/transferase [Methyloligella sp. 2.7D]|uniref:sulfatase-like hydrolase/transferase n=1 Tax=unclassified Methyloligella TaxID=2625955 RepID=UPI00157BB7C0|nr:sulfatase-like hydrolase/transferase [Methyloligella sp. GL2]QKP76339.1 sulfatase-like hydrolase/transferase [Methyloligella sp. GL2]